MYFCSSQNPRGWRNAARISNGISQNFPTAEIKTFRRMTFWQTQENVELVEEPVIGFWGYPTELHR